MKKAKPAGVTIITPGHSSPNTDILTLHFPLPEAPGASGTATAAEVLLKDESSGSGATEAEGGGTV